MIKSATLLGAVLCVVILLGLALATLGRSAPATETQVRQPIPAATPSTPVPSMDQRITTSPVASPTPAVSEALRAQIVALGKQLEAAAAARQQLQDEFSLMKETIQTLEQRLDGLTETQPDDDPEPTPATSARQREEEALVTAGFDAEEAEYLVNRWGQQQMDLLYLRDQARREGWINTPRYEQAVRELSNGDDSIREEIGPEAYDRFLFAAGRANRVVLDSIIDSSPAQTVGLQAGDTILSYDGNRIFSVNDLRNATSAGDPGVPVVIEIDRDGQRLAYDIDRGPIGVRLGRRRIKP